MQIVCPVCHQSGVVFIGEKTDEVQCPNCGRFIPALRITTNPPESSSRPIGAQAPGHVAAASAPNSFAAPPQPTGGIRHATSQASGPVVSGLAVASMVLGIVGVMGSFMILGFLPSILATVFGHLSFNTISKNPESYSGRGFACAGITLGYTAICYGIILLIVLAPVFAFMDKLITETDRAFQQISNQYTAPIPNTPFPMKR